MIHHVPSDKDAVVVMDWSLWLGISLNNGFLRVKRLVFIGARVCNLVRDGLLGTSCASDWRLLARWGRGRGL
jgi:hypothetical protein